MKTGGVCLMPPHATIWEGFLWRAFSNSSEILGHGLGSIFFIHRQSHFVAALVGS